VYKTLETKIISLYRGADSIEEIGPGASISIETSLDPFLSKTDSLSGCIVSLRGNLPEISDRIKFKSNLFKDVLGAEQNKDAIKTKETLMLSINTTTTIGIVEKIDGDDIEMSLKIPVVALKRDNLGIARNINNHWRLIGLGEIL
jgi:translation initiation factor 2 subunit 3